MTSALWSTPLPGILLTLLAFFAGELLQRRAGGHPLLNPVAIAILLVAATLKLFGIAYGVYFESAGILHWLLGPATVALAIPLARELSRLRHLARPVALAILAGALTAAASAMAFARLFGADRAVLLSLAPKSVTTPIAMGISREIGGIPSLTAVLVILTGLLGAIFGRFVLDRLNVRDPAARGIATGVASHGLGTASIYRESTEAGAYSGLAMGLAGLLTALFLPLLVRLLGLD